MSILTASNLAVAYGAHDVFAGVSLAVPANARIALVGRNGSGKTSLLRVLAGLDRPASGSVASARTATVGYLAQHPDFPDARSLFEEMLTAFSALEAQGAELERLQEEMADPALAETATARYASLQERFELAGGYTYPTRIAQVLSGLGFDATDHERPLGDLSGGQRTRAMLARLLLQTPDVLLLDEPTNHLDVDSLEWLEDTLRTLPSAVVVVAHDRAFLDVVVDKVWELTSKGLDHYSGNYSAYLRQRTERLQTREAAIERQRREIARTEDFIRRNIAGQNTKQAQGRRTRLERVERIEARVDEGPPGLRLGRARRSGDVVFKLEGVAAGYDPEQPVVQSVSVTVYRGDRITILGKNGSGKTTLLRTLVGELPPISGTVRHGAAVALGHFAQTQGHLDASASALECVMGASELQPEAARSLLARYGFTGDDVFKTVAVLSGGERARVALCLLEQAGANVLLLDEPTNHLDLPSQEALQSVLAEFDGTMLLVTHDRHLMRALGHQVWALADGRIEVFRDGYDAYRAARAASSGTDAAKDTRSSSYDADRLERRREERELQRQNEERATLERLHAALESDLERLRGELHEATLAQDVTTITRLGDEYAQTEREAQEALRRWVALEEGGAGQTARE